jgi:hypothetical protein
LWYWLAVLLVIAPVRVSSSVPSGDEPATLSDFEVLAADFDCAASDWLELELESEPEFDSLEGSLVSCLIEKVLVVVWELRELPEPPPDPPHLSESDDELLLLPLLLDSFSESLLSCLFWKEGKNRWEMVAKTAGMEPVEASPAPPTENRKKSGKIEKLPWASRFVAVKGLEGLW